MLRHSRSYAAGKAMATSSALPYYRLYTAVSRQNNALSPSRPFSQKVWVLLDADQTTGDASPSLDADGISDRPDTACDSSSAAKASKPLPFRCSLPVLAAGHVLKHHVSSCTLQQCHLNMMSLRQ